MEIDADSLVYAFLKAARERDIAALVTYGFLDPRGKPVMRAASNSSEQGTQAALAFLSSVDERALEAAARAVHGQARCPICQQESEAQTRWEDLWDSAKGWHLDVVRVAVATVKKHAGKALVDIKDVTS